MFNSNIVQKLLVQQNTKLASVSKQ